MNLRRAQEIAIKAHTGQLDKGGGNYITHPLRVMQNVVTEDEKMVAVMHDVVEDTPITLDDLRAEGFSDIVVEGVRCMSRDDDESYNKYIQKVMTNKIAVRVKIADLTDNLNITRLRSLEDISINNLGMYLGTYHKLIKYERENK